MVSEKRSQAARANGARSRGPKTPQGKAISSRNATRHGLLSGIVVLSTEEESGFLELFNCLLARFSPVDDIELSAIEEMAAAHWRARRAMAMEHSILETAIANQPGGTPIEKTTAAFCDPAQQQRLALLQRYEARLQNIYQRALRTLAQLRKLPARTAARPVERKPLAPLPNEPKTPSVCNAVEPEPATSVPPDAPSREFADPLLDPEFDLLQAAFLRIRS
jgi:hypothetical protein